MYLYHPGIATAGFTKLTFFIHGGAAGGQKLQLSATRASDTSGNHGPEVTLPQPAANTWTEVQVPLANLGADGTTITGLTWHDSTGGAQPTLYIDDIALASDESPDGPALSAGALLPRAARADGATGVVVQARVADPQGPADIASVTLDAAALGRGTVELRDDGRSNDGAAADGLYGAVLTVAPGTPTGEQQLLVSARDQAGHQASLRLGAFEVLGPAGGAIPTALPQRIGWGTNQWSETAGQDWQVNSGVPWDYDYQYITWGWEELGPELRHSICESGLEQKLYSGDLGVYDTRRPALERRGRRVIRREAPERDYSERLSGIACASRDAGQGLQAGDLPHRARLLRLYAGVQIQQRPAQPRRPQLLPGGAQYRWLPEQPGRLRAADRGCDPHHRAECACRSPCEHVGHQRRPE